MRKYTGCQNGGVALSQVEWAIALEIIFFVTVCQELVVVEILCFENLMMGESDSGVFGS